MATHLQKPIVHPPTCNSEGRWPIIEFTTGWILSTITCWDGREHTPSPSSGFGHYPLTYEVLSVIVLLDRTLMERIIDNPGHLLQGCQEG